jgi:hypothetical protein
MNTRIVLSSMNPLSETSPSTVRPKGAVTIYQHYALFRILGELLEEKAKKGGYKGPRTPSQFFERETIRIIRREGRKLGFKLPSEFAGRS